MFFCCILSGFRSGSSVPLRAGLREEEIHSLLHYIYSGMRPDSLADPFILEKDIEKDERQFLADMQNLRKVRI